MSQVLHGFQASQGTQAGNRKTSTEIIATWETCCEVGEGRESCGVEAFARDRPAGVWE